MSTEITIANISEYVQSVCQLNADTNKFPQLWSQELLFRGQSNKAYELLPGIARGRHSSCQCTIFNDERNLIEMAKFKMPDVFRNDQTPLELRRWKKNCWNMVIMFLNLRFGIKKPESEKLKIELKK